MKAMIIIITLVLLIIWTALLTSIYSIVNPFLYNLWEIKNYNIAYYWAIWSIERWLLVLKYHKQWFEWSWWWNWNINYWNINDKIQSWFSLLWANKNWMRFEIKSRNQWQIPSNWKWNIEFDFRWNWSENFNKLEYKSSEEIILDIDNTTNSWNYYTWIINRNYAYNFLNSSPQISGTFRLPSKIYSWFWNLWLCTTCDLDWDLIWNDIIINRSLFGSFNWNIFSIIPINSVNYSTNQPLENDTFLREDIINNSSTNIKFWNSSNPITSRSISDWKHNSIPETFWLSWSTFSTILQNNQISWLHLKFSLVNFALTQSKQLYPFIEYKLEILNNSTAVTIPDRFFHIYWNSKVWKYHVIIKIDKPVINTNSSSDFTILF